MGNKIFIQCVPANDGHHYSYYANYQNVNAVTVHIKPMPTLSWLIYPVCSPYQAWWLGLVGYVCYVPQGDRKLLNS